VIYRSALLVAAAIALVAILTGKDIVRTRRVTLNQLQYNVTLFSNNTIEVEREDGLRFSMDLAGESPKLLVGTEAQLEDAMLQLKKSALAQLGAV
jgi:hypothetical protein